MDAMNITLSPEFLDNLASTRLSLPVETNWSLHTDEEGHYTYTRCVNSAAAIWDSLHVHHGKNGEPARFVHAMHFFAEWTEDELVELLKGFGYESLDDYVIQTSPFGFPEPHFVDKPDGSLDREASQSFFIDYESIAAMAAETMDGRAMSNADADALAKAIVGE